MVLKPGIKPWYFFLGVDWTSSAYRNGKKFYPTKHREGVLIVHNDGVVQWISKEWYEDLNE